MSRRNAIRLSIALLCSCWLLACSHTNAHAQPVDLSGIVNVYSSVTAVLPCPNIVRVEHPELFAVGDTVLLIQMKGASVDTVEGPTFGRVTAMNRAGRFERNIVEVIRGNDIQLSYRMLSPPNAPGYEAGQGVQLIRIPSYTDARVTATLTCPPWDGKTGGVLVFTVRNLLELAANINVDGKGFEQEDGIARAELAGGAASGGTGAFATGGLATAGRGGAWRPDANNVFATWGGGGGAQAGCGGMANGFTSQPVTYGTGSNWIFMGGGGGSSDSGASAGGRGGGIAIIDAPRIVSNNAATISTRGLPGAPGVGYDQQSMEGRGAGGGGAGGTLLITATELYLIPVLIADGGPGGNSNTDNTRAGAGGGGGAVLLGTTSPNNLITVSAVGGVGGLRVGTRADNGCVGLSSYNNLINESKQRFNARTFWVSPDTTVCEGSQATLVADVDGVVSWLKGATTLCTNCDTLRTIPDSTTTYAAVLAYSDGCTDTARVVVTMRASPSVSIPDPPPFCDSIVVTAPAGFMRYVWSTGDTTQAITIRSARTTTLTVFDDLGCSDTVSFVTRYRGDTVLAFETLPPDGSPLFIDSIFPGERACIGVPVRNTSDADLAILTARMARGIEISVPQAQFPLNTSPVPPGTPSVTIAVCAGAMVPGVYTDTMFILSPCGETACPVTATVLETIWYTRCHVRITSDGEIEVLAAERPVVADLMGRTINVQIERVGEGAYYVKGLAPGAYIIRAGRSTALFLH